MNDDCLFGQAEAARWGHMKTWADGALLASLKRGRINTKNDVQWAVDNRKLLELLVMRGNFRGNLEVWSVHQPTK